MDTALVLLGVVCIIGAIVGGGIKAVQLEMGQVASIARQVTLATFGVVLCILGLMLGGHIPAFSSGKPTTQVAPSPSPSPTPSYTKAAEPVAEAKVEPSPTPQPERTAPTTPVPAGSVEEPLREITPPAPQSEISVSEWPNEGWVFIGSFDSQSGAWKTRYWSVENTAPSRLLNRRLLSTGAVNVRDSAPTPLPAGAYGKKIDSLPADRSAIVQEILDWEKEGYIWARVRY